MLTLKIICLIVTAIYYFNYFRICWTMGEMVDFFAFSYGVCVVLTLSGIFTIGILVDWIITYLP